MNVKSCTKGKLMNQYGAHAHKEWEIIVVRTGKLQMKIEEHLHTVEEGGVIVLPPNTVHSAVSEEKFCDIYVRAENLDFYDANVVKDVDGSILLLMELLNKVLLEKENHYQRIADSLLETICQYIKKMIELNYKHDFVVQVKNAIFEGFTDCDFSVKAQIDKTGFQQDYVRRCFKAETGKTPLEYLTHLRMNLAKDLLRQITYTRIEDIAGKCGFKDSFYFSVCFRKHTGSSPSEYRKINI